VNETQEKELKAQFKRFVKITLDDRILAFKPLNKAKVADLKKQTSAKPELSVDLLIGACKFCCIFGLEHFDELANEYPLAFTGAGEDAPGVIDELMRMAHGAVSIEVK
jgi:hypothetical protein